MLLRNLPDATMLGNGPNGKCVTRVHLIKGPDHLLFFFFFFPLCAMGGSCKKALQMWSRYWSRGMDFFVVVVIAIMKYQRQP